eukprot:TRINITY_DN21392_c0_g1_i8.p2 TRINITY_DN21392_c0_g1~~TRINITY_DN21392_c0_g1_i8.p2  ORF type:complete len:180 (+),score=17.47 TRINITY_DN21392_c0_g1_i8:96-635(+)
MQTVLIVRPVLARINQVHIGRYRKYCTPRPRKQICYSLVENDWQSLAQLYQEDEDFSPEEDPEYIQTINEICNKTLKTILSSDIQRLLSLKDELNEIGEACVECNQIQGALFMYILYKLCENSIPKEVDDLKGVYHSAFVKIFGLLEDSGWGMQRENQEGQQMIDDELFQQPPRMGPYN